MTVKTYPSHPYYAGFMVDVSSVKFRPPQAAEASEWDDEAVVGFLKPPPGQLLPQIALLQVQSGLQSESLPHAWPSSSILKTTNNLLALSVNFPPFQQLESKMDNNAVIECLKPSFPATSPPSLSRQRQLWAA